MQQVSLPDFKEFCQGADCSFPTKASATEAGHSSESELNPGERTGRLSLPPLLVQTRAGQTSICPTGFNQWRLQPKSVSPPFYSASTNTPRSCTPASFGSSTVPLASPVPVQPILDVHSPAQLGASAFAAINVEGASPQLGRMYSSTYQLGLHRPSFVPKRHGWFDPERESARLTWQHMSSMTRDERYEALFECPCRPLYPDQKSNQKELEPKPKPVRSKYTSDSLYRAHLNKWEQGERHRIKEKQRRNRHRGLQSLAHHMTCKVANSLAERDPALVQIRTERSNGGVRSKVAGKDDQLVASIYQKNISAIVVQSEHEGRMIAEAEGQELRAKLAEADTKNAELRSLLHKMNNAQIVDHNEPDVEYQQHADPESLMKKRKHNDSPTNCLKVTQNGHSSLSCRLPRCLPVSLPVTPTARTGVRSTADISYEW